MDLIQILCATNMSINNSIFSHNNAPVRTSILYIRESHVETCHISINTSNTLLGYIINILRSEVKFEMTHYYNNSGSVRIIGSKVIFSKLSKFQNNEHRSSITSITSTIHFQNTTKFCNNYSRDKGSALYAFESHLYAQGNILFYDNSARSSGGALYLDRSDFVCQKNCTFIGNKASMGGAIHAVDSKIKIGSNEKKFLNDNTLLIFASNSAEKGGAIYLEANSKLRVPKEMRCTFILKFDDNRANFGAAIFVNDFTYICKQSTCFVQAPFSCRDGWIKINSTNKNIAAIYGGLLDRCTVEHQYFESYFIPMKGIDYITRATNNASIKHIISSQPVRVCYCNGRNVSCNNKRKILDVKKGETFKVVVAALDQANHMVNASVFVTSTQNYIHLQKTKQQVQNECSNLTLKVFSPNDSVELTLHVNSPCKNEEVSEAITLHVNFKNCTCPIGF